MASSDSVRKDRYDAGPRETDPAGRARPVATPVVVAAIIIPLVLLAGALLWVRTIGDEASEPRPPSPTQPCHFPRPERRPRRA